MADLATNAPIPPEAPEGPRCANCATRLLGPFCYACGQHREAHHRSLRHLMAEMLENLTEADGRLWRTLSRLALRPARLTRDYIDGHRVAEIPPLRLFLVALVLVFAVGSFGRANRTSFVNLKHDAPHIEKEINKITIKNHPDMSHWLRDHVGYAVENPDEVAHTMREWAERFAFLLLPLSAFSLKLLFPLRRDFTLYDHTIFTLHSLSFAGMLIAVEMVLNTMPVIDKWSSFLMFALPVHLFAHMRGLYRISTFATLVRMAALGIMSLFSFLLILTSLSLLSLALAG